jgi:hypothetical protein
MRRYRRRAGKERSEKVPTMAAFSADLSHHDVRDIDDKVIAAGATSVFKPEATAWGTQRAAP